MRTLCFFVCVFFVCELFFVYELCVFFVCELREDTEQNVRTRQSTQRRGRRTTRHHNAAQLSTARVGAATDDILPGHREHTGGSRQDTHGTPVLTTVRRLWVAQPHEHAHATQVTDTSCEQGWRPNSLVAE